MFDVSNRSERPPPEMPNAVGIDYPRAASWSSSTVAEILRDPYGKFKKKKLKKLLLRSF